LDGLYPRQGLGTVVDDRDIGNAKLRKRGRDQASDLGIIIDDECP